MPVATIAVSVAVMLAAAIVLNLGCWWATVRVFDRFGRMLRFEQFVAVRHLRGRKSGFLTAIGILSILGVSFSSCTLTTVLSVMGGFSNDLKQKILKTNAHVVVDGFGADLPGPSSIDPARGERPWTLLLSAVRKVEGVTAATPLVLGEVMMNARTNNHGVQLKGIDPGSFAKVSSVLDMLEKGNLSYVDRPDALFDEVQKRRSRLYGLDASPSIPHAADAGPAAEAKDAPKDAPALGSSVLPPADGPRRRVLPVVIVGRELSRSLRLFVGEEVNIVSPFGDLGPTGPIPKSRPFRVGGVFFSGMYEFDSLFAYVSLADAQKFLRKGDRVTEIQIAVDDPDRADVVASRIAASLGGKLRVKSWKELNASLFSALKLEKIVMFIFLSMAILVASFCILATLTMLVLEKGAEISVLMTLGAAPRAVQGIFQFEGLLIGVVGTASGLLVGFGLCTMLQKVGLPIDPEVWYIDRLPVKMDGLEFFLVGLASLVITQIATLYPTFAAARLTPVEGLKNE
ncbi:MAG: ABC transporter permease [Deltaproteobacteria bacterium]|nr:ABC transporter permease [Deltaproteobacteria bacterium]